MAPVHLYYWAGAKAAAGTAEETVEAASVREALELVCAGRGEAFRRVVRACSLLIDGVAGHEGDLDRLLEGPVRVEVLPPFAGGAEQAGGHSGEPRSAAEGCARDHDPWSQHLDLTLLTAGVRHLDGHLMLQDRRWESFLGGRSLSR